MKPYSPEIDKIFSGCMEFSRHDESYDSGDSEVENASLGPRMHKYLTILPQDAPFKVPLKQINGSVSAQTNFHHQQFTYGMIDDHYNAPTPLVPKYGYEQRMTAPGMEDQNPHQDSFPLFYSAPMPSQDHNGPFRMFGLMERPQPSGLVTPPPPEPKQGNDSSMMGFRRGENSPPFQITPMAQHEANSPMLISAPEWVYFVDVSPTPQNEPGNNSDSVHYSFYSEFYAYSVIKSDLFAIAPGVKTTSKLIDEEWLISVLVLKLNTWLKRKINNGPPSLVLVNLEEYQRCYDELKNRYAKSIASFWCMGTDPIKFIHEDLGIAAYLLCLWRNDTIKKPRFVDIGCGNGLLVYILNSEEFEGTGVDIRKRNIWDSYPDKVRRNLIEMTVDPQVHPGFPEADWLIGNHSDELTPWLPILAARSNPHCRVFVIPCCAFSLFHKFDLGKHRIPTDSAGSVWQGRFGGYLSYLMEHFKSCGFIPELDILRIPSTKRFCIVGRNFPLNDSSTRVEKVNSVIQSENPLKSAFTPRKEDSGKAPSSLSMEDRVKIGANIFSKVLELGSTKEKILTVDGRLWNSGGCLSIKEACERLDPEVVAKLKLIRGGLQTVLRNQHQTFMVTGEGIRLRYEPEGLKANGNKNRPWKKTPCWMESNHPDGCPYPASLCRFAHRME
ncbi:unnamed protein product [Rodentolepis nana]|uniref:tRNA (uracil-O(2)-)-methyltransferase n=1 Tax=Rodentolepis nana TaxID=102285 RepID=A0A0R3T7M4_RODNA|nr:unnamed protein product [Rodentolepis nana]